MANDAHDRSKEPLRQRLTRVRVLPVITVEDAEQGVALVRALAVGGLDASPGLLRWRGGYVRWRLVRLLANRGGQRKNKSFGPWSDWPHKRFVEEHGLYYDGLSMMRSLVSNTDQAKVFLYPCLLSRADDERFAVFECVSGAAPSTCASGDQRILWYMRDLDGKVLRSWVLQVEGQHWTWREDNIFRAGQPLATVTNDSAGNQVTHHLHLDHLGTPRQITDSTGTQLALHHHYPFGQEAKDSRPCAVDLLSAIASRRQPATALETSSKRVRR